LRALVLDLPVLDEKALGVAVLVFVARADTPEGRDLLALLLRELGLFSSRRAEHATRDVVVNARELGAHLRTGTRHPPLGRAARFGLAPLPVQIDQQVLAGGLHAILAERELGRRLALAQQRDPVAQALGELARIEVARRGGVRRFAALRAGLALEVGDERR